MLRHITGDLVAVNVSANSSERSRLWRGRRSLTLCLEELGGEGEGEGGKGQGSTGQERVGVEEGCGDVGRRGVVDEGQVGGLLQGGVEEAGGGAPEQKL